jgi:hypothetical protein
VRSAYSFHRVLAGFDGSPDAAAALRLAATICDNGELVVLCVIARALPDSDGEGTDGAGLRAEAELLLSELARAVHACPVPLLLTSAPARDAQAAMSRGTACAGRY